MTVLFFKCWQNQTSVKVYYVFRGCGKMSALSSHSLPLMQFSVRRSQELPLGGNCLVTRTFGCWVNVLGILLQSCSRAIQLHSWKRKSLFPSQDNVLWNECSHENWWHKVCWGPMVPSANICISEMPSWEHSCTGLKVFWISLVVKWPQLHPP